MKHIKITATCVIQVNDSDVAQTKEELMTDLGYEAFETLETASQNGQDDFQIRVDECDVDGNVLPNTGKSSVPDKADGK